MTREEAARKLEVIRIMDAPSLCEALDMAIEALRQDERPKGRYIRDLNYTTLGNCSLCNADMTCSDNYCPNCGADMREEAQE